MKIKFPLWVKILIGFALGIICGIILKLVLKDQAGSFSTTWINPIGILFLNLIKMLIVPLIFSSLFVGVSSIGDPKKLGRIGGKTVGLYLFTTCMAISIGIILAIILNPGSYVDSSLKNLATNTITPETFNPINTLLQIIPQNPILAISKTNILQIIFFALMTGIAASLIGEKGKSLINLMNSCAETMYKLTELVMKTAPLGVFALITNSICTQGVSILLGLLMVIITVYIGCFLNSLIVYGGLIKILGKSSMLKFFQAILPAQLVAFSTCSSSGTLPVTLECNEKNLGVSKSISSFIIPLGATINMDGTSLYQGVCALFVAQIYGIELTFTHYATIILTGTLASIGTAGIPGGGLIMLSLILSSAGLPLEGIAIIAGIDRILDMARTTMNITGDSAVNYVVAKSEGEVKE